MSGEREPVMTRERSGDDELRFMGEITPAVTHEMRNVLATIRESAGLVGDLMEMAPQGSFPGRERVTRALKSIEEQVERGVELAGKLNRFAHSVDDRWAEISLDELVEEICLLLARKARNRKASLVSLCRGTRVRIQGDPFHLRLLICRCIENCLDETGAGGSVEIEVKGSERGANLKMTSRGPSEKEEPEAKSHREWIEKFALNAGIEVLRGEGPGEKWTELFFKS